ncbi:caspase family protein [Thermodesulfobacteriota bacterium]
MNRVNITLIIVISVSLIFPGVSYTERGAKSGLALVIGNSDYEIAPLTNPVNDAKDIMTALKNLEFDVIYRCNANQLEMEDAIRDFGKRLREFEVGLFYFAGHGIQVGGRNYLIPVDAKIETESDVKYESVDAGRVLGKMEDAENDLNIVILDACRDNPFARSFRTQSGGLAKMDAPKGSLIAYATAPGSVASDGTGRNGIYTKHLLKYMREPGLPIENVLKKVRIGVMEETGDKQVPWESSSLRGDFYFKPKRGIHIASPQSDTDLIEEKKRLKEAVKQQGLIDKARLTFQSFINDNNYSWIQKNLSRAKGLIIIPSLLKGGIILGGSGGSGVLIVKDEKTGEWSQPAFYSIGSLSFGLQFGGEAAEVIMMVISQKGIDKLLATSFKLGGDTSVAAGPVGEGLKANVNIDIFSFTRSRGAYAGISVEGAVIKVKDKWNEAYYGRPVRPVDIFIRHSVSNPGAAELLKLITEAEWK